MSFVFSPILAYNTAGSTDETIQLNKSNESFTKTIVPKSIRDIVIDATNKYGVSFNQVWTTIGCETKYTYNPTIQSEALRPDGTREKSYGLAQIYLPAHPEVSYEQAIDPYFAADFIAKNWSKHKTMWSCWNNKQ